MRERRFGRVINISSSNGQAGQIGQTNYAAAEAGILGFSKALAQDRVALVLDFWIGHCVTTDVGRAVPDQSFYVGVDGPLRHRMCQAVRS